jgi:hypothetical protein
MDADESLIFDETASVSAAAERIAATYCAESPVMRTRAIESLT